VATINRKVQGDETAETGGRYRHTSGRLLLDRAPMDQPTMNDIVQGHAGYKEHHIQQERIPDSVYPLA
jgi:hypothetical protein